MNKKVKILGISLCGAAILSVGSFAAIHLYNANADVELTLPQEYSIQSEYTYGDTLVVPAPSSVSIKAGLVETKAVSVVLSYPDGMAKSEGSYTLDRTGEYTLTYYNANGVSATQKFIVNKNFYGVSDGANAEYVTDLVGQEGREGISISLEDGNSFTFNKTINLKDYEGEALEVCKIFPLFRDDPDVDPDASTVSVKLVDCYDATKFVEYYIWCGGAGQGVYYMGAGASTQSFTGLEQNANRPHEMTEAYNGEMYKIHRPQRYQSKTAWGAGMASKDTNQLITHDGLTLVWDLATHQMQAKTGSSLRLITDIDSPEIYGTNAIDFDGFFTTGEVYLNVEAYNYTTTSFNVDIERIFGMEGDELKNGKLVDTKAPEVFVDVETTEGNAVYLQKGETVTLPAIAKILDYNYYGNERIAVYRNYRKPGQVSVSVENGSFVPTALGNYTAVYTATDSYGNVGEYCLEMVVLDEQKFVYEVEPVSNLIAAKSNVLPALNVTGMNKEVTVSVVATAPNGEEKTLDYNGVDGYEYIPEYVGQYKITYVLKDNVYEEKYSYDVICADQNSAAFKNPFTLPSYLMKGASYTVKPIIAYTAGDGCFKENTATVSVSVDGGAYQTLSEEQMNAYKVEANATLQLKASYGEGFVESPVYSVVDVGYGKKASQKTYLNYVQGNYTSAEMTENGAAYSFAGDANVQFINAISSSHFKTTFAVQATKVDKVVVTLREARNPNGSYVVYTYQKVGSSIVLNAKQYVDKKVVLECSLPTKYSALMGEYTLTYSVAGMTTGGVTAEGVQAFAEDNAIFEVSVLGATEGCSFVLSQLNNQSISSSLTRESKPQMTYAECNGVREINSIHEIAPCYASAVMSSVLDQDAKVTVAAPNGEIVSDVDGTVLENVPANRTYNVKLSQVGQYRVTYAASCLGSTRTNGQETLSDDDYYIINVSEGVAPTIKFKDGSNTQTTINLTVGSTHKVKEFVVTDNVTAKENIKVYTMILDKNFILEENGYDVSSYEFKNVGEFVVYVLAYDELGNSSALYYNVVVS